MMKAYRLVLAQEVVQRLIEKGILPLSNAAKIPEIGRWCLCFQNLHDAYGYIKGCHGDSCDLYEVVGEVIRTGVEDVQTEYQEDQPVAQGRKDREVIQMIPIVELRVASFRKLGTFNVVAEEEEQMITVRMSYTALNLF